MNKLLTILIYLLLFIPGYVFASDNLRVLDPQASWRYAQGNIEDATISMRPRGLYMEYGVYLTISARGANFSANDNLEVQFNFDLPEGAIVQDMWLWVGNNIMKAYLLDSWTASSIYENIVNRRRDPAILFKRTATNYEMRIYPLPGDGKRRIKLNYLVPMQWTPSMVTSPLPVNLLKTSKTLPSIFHLLYWPDQEWKNPQILEQQQTKFVDVSDNEFGSYKKTDVPLTGTAVSMNISYDTPMKNGFYANYYSKGDEGIYQFAFLPSEGLDMKFNRKTAILFDMEDSKSTVKVSELYNTLKSNLLRNFTKKDSFNLFIMSQFEVKSASGKWLPGDSATINATFDLMEKNQISSYTSMSPLLTAGLNFIKNNGNNGSIFLLSNADDLGSSTAANAMLAYLSGIMKPLPPVFIADFNSNWVYNYIGNKYYYGNEYLYTNLSRITYAEFQELRNSGRTASQIIESTLLSLNGYISNFDLYTSLQNGFCYGRINSTGSEQGLYLSRPILQVGRFKGTMPLKLQVSGTFQNNSFSKEFIADSASRGDSVLEKIWAGNNIRNLESKPQTNTVVSQILYESLHSRILSLYSAFLALEPSDTVKACKDCMDEAKLVSVASVPQAKDTTLVQGFPNPFNSQVNIQVTLPQIYLAKDISCRIYNLLGQEVRTFAIGETGVTRTLKFAWGGTNDRGEVMPSGIYIFVVNTPAGRHSLKLMLLK